MKGMLAVLIGHVSVLSHTPLSKRNEILSGMSSMLSAALAEIKPDTSADEAAGFERTIGVVANLARDFIRIEAAAARHGEAHR